MATMYWKLLNWQDTIHASIQEKAANKVLAALILGIVTSFTSIVRLLCWRWAGLKEIRLQRFVIATVLGTTALAFIILGLLFRDLCIAPGFCSGQAYHSIVHLQVRPQEHTWEVLTDYEAGCFPRAQPYNVLHSRPGIYRLYDLF
jgi:hypothetical protein